MNLGRWVDEALTWVAPERCLGCGAVPAPGGCCAGCHTDLPWNLSACAGCAQPLPVSARCARCLRRAPAFDSAWTPFVRRSPVRDGVNRLKYGADFQQARVLGGLMAERLLARAEPLPDLLVPVPLAHRRLLLRGHNQAMELARVLGQRCRIAVDPGAARLVRAVRDQIGQTREQRRRNLRGAFVVSRDLSGRHVALVDDVMTTGATLEAMAKAARAAGAAHIEAWALARSP